MRTPTHVDSVPRVRAHQFPRGGPGRAAGARHPTLPRRGAEAARPRTSVKAARTGPTGDRRTVAPSTAFARSLRPANVRQPPGRPRAGARRRARAYAAVSGCRASAAYVARRPQSDRRGAQTLAVAEIAPLLRRLPPRCRRAVHEGCRTGTTRSARTAARREPKPNKVPTKNHDQAEAAPTPRALLRGALAYLVTVVAMRRMPRTYLCRNHEVVQKAVPAGGSSSPAHRPRSCRTRTESVHSPPIPLRSRPSSRAIILHHSTSHSEPAQPPDRRAAA